jgi:hypothetical protein
MTIEHYSFGRIVINGTAHTSDVILWPEGVDDTWWRAEGHVLSTEDLEPILSKNPDALIIGTGAQGSMRVAPEVLREMQQRCEEVYVEQTEKACALYNDLCEGPARVVAALHLTC